MYVEPSEMYPIHSTTRPFLALRTAVIALPMTLHVFQLFLREPEVVADLVHHCEPDLLKHLLG